MKTVINRKVPESPYQVEADMSNVYDISLRSCSLNNISSKKYTVGTDVFPTLPGTHISGFNITERMTLEP